MKFEIPKPMKVEHDELHADLVKAIKAGGQTAEAAKIVAKQKIAFPPENP